jgi:hypothetical protein
MISKTHRQLSSLSACTGTLVGIASGLLMAAPTQAQLSQAQINESASKTAGRIEAATILGGDFGIGGGTFNSTHNNNNNSDLTINKFGGAGEIGAPQPLGSLDIAWQPRLQGSMGYLEDKNNFQGSDPNAGDESKLDTFAIQFGGGARFWFNDAFSIAPTFMGMYGYSKEEYTANSAYGKANDAQANQAGIINWNVDTWTVRPSMNFAYQYAWNRTIFTLSTEPTYFYTESFESSSSAISVSGDSETWENKLDVDAPLGVELFGQELRTGGYFERTEFYNGISNGLSTDYLYEIHGRFVLDFLGELWKVKWLGIGASYFWSDNFDGWSVGVDANFRF